MLNMLKGYLWFWDRWAKLKLNYYWLKGKIKVVQENNNWNYMAWPMNNIYILLIMWKVSTDVTKNDGITKSER